MQQTDLVYRTLVDKALDGRRSWRSVAGVAQEAGVGEKLAYKALTRLTTIGAVTRHSGGGFSVTDPERVLAIAAARHSLADGRSTTLPAAQGLVDRVGAYAVSGTRAAVHHLGGSNSIADHGPGIVYIPDDVELDVLTRGHDVLVITADVRSLRTWPDGYASKAQTYMDLFAQPGWQASEFRRALWKAWFSVDDWARAEAGVA